MSEGGDIDSGDLEFLASVAHVAWGFMCPEYGFVEVPKVPLVRAGLRAPPMDVTLFDGRVRHIIQR